MRAAVFTGVGGPDVVTIVRRSIPAPAHGEVLVRIHASAMNRADVLQRQGKYPPPPGAPPDVGGLELELDSGVGRDHQLVIREGAVGVVVAPQPLLAGRFDPQRLAFQRGEARLAGRAAFAGVVGEDDAEDEEQGREDRQQAANPELQAAAAEQLARLGPALGAVAAHDVEQRKRDRDHEDRGGEGADPKQGVDLVSARGVRRQSAAILFTRGGAAACGHLRAADLYSPP